jgi:hypothetical protein
MCSSRSLGNDSPERPVLIGVAVQGLGLDRCGRRRSLPALVELQLTRSWSAPLEAVLRQPSTQCSRAAPAEHSMLQGCLSRGASSLRHLAAELACQRVSGCISRPALRLSQPSSCAASQSRACASRSTQCFQAALRPAATAACSSCRRRNRTLFLTAARGVLFTSSFSAQSRGPRRVQMHRRAHQLQAGHRRLRVSMHALVELCPQRLHDLATAPAHCGGSALRLVLAACGCTHSCSAAAVGATRATDAAARPAVRCCLAPLQPICCARCSLPMIDDHRVDVTDSRGRKGGAIAPPLLFLPALG